MDKNMQKIVATLLGAGCVMASAQAEVVPSVQVKQKYTDNVYRQPSNEEHSWITTVNPTIALKMQSGNNQYEVGASAEAGYYTVDSRNDYVDWAGYAKAGLEFDSRNHFDINLQQSRGHDEIGTGRTEGGFDWERRIKPEEPDEYDQTDADVKYTFGAKDARGRLVLRDIYMDRDYANHRRDLINGTTRLDRTENEVRTTAYLRVQPKTSVLLEAREKDIDYDKSYHSLLAAGASPIMDSDESRVYVGAEWEATAKTTGSVRFGHMEKDFREPQGFTAPVDDYDMPSWETTITWRPRTYSSFTLNTSRGFVESTSGDAVIDRTDIGLKWKHDWSSLLGSNVFLQHFSDEYKAFSNNPRSDVVQRAGAGLTYSLANWAELSADYVFEDLNSTQNNKDYTRNLLVFGVDFKFD